MNVFLEYVIVFVVLYILNYFLVIRNNLKYDKKKLPIELTYLKKVYKVNINKDEYKNFLYIYSFVNIFIITTIYIILIYLLDNLFLRILIGIVLLTLMIIICYGLLARYYLRKEGR